MRHGKTMATWTLTTACWGLAGIALLAMHTGCDKMESKARQADREVDKNLVKSQADSEVGGDKAQARTAVSVDLQQASGEAGDASKVAGASNAAKIRATSELAREEFNQASAQCKSADTGTWWGLRPANESAWMMSVWSVCPVNETALPSSTSPAMLLRSAASIRAKLGST